MTPPLVCWVVLALASGQPAEIDALQIAALEAIDERETEVVLTSGERLAVADPIEDVAKAVRGAVCKPRRIEG